MRKYFNIIPAEDSCCILMYGNIGEWAEVTSGDITRELMEAEANYKKIDVRINSNGGEVYAGIAIFNAFRNSKADITIYIDGIAASMASVIALCGKPVHMSKYARLMLHSVSGGVYGNKKDIQECLSEIEDLEDTLCDMYASRISKSKEEIKAAYFDGKDHWIKAQEALDLGLIDGIYDADPIPEESTPDDIYRAFNNRLEEPQNKNDMKLEDVRKRKRFAACASDEDVLKELDVLESEAAKVPTLQGENKTLKDANDAYKQEAEARAEDEKKALLDTAENDGRLDAKTRPIYKDLLDANREKGEAALKALPKKRNAIQDIAGGGDPSKESPWEKRQKEIANNLKR